MSVCLRMCVCKCVCVSVFLRVHVCVHVLERTCTAECRMVQDACMFVRRMTFVYFLDRYLKSS